MGETDYNALLYDKMKAEQDKYRDWLLSQPPEEILNHTYEYTMREDIVMCMEELELSPKQAKALLRSPCPLDDVYKEFKDREVEHMADDIGILNHGHLLFEGTKEELKTNARAAGFPTDNLEDTFLAMIDEDNRRRGGTV